MTEKSHPKPLLTMIAMHAGVSRRAAFRHFDNIEVLQEEASRLQIERVSREPFPPLMEEGTLEQRIDALGAILSQELG